jgi:monolysocardiolipin acyltransferase
MRKMSWFRVVGGTLLSSGLGVYAIAHHYRHVPDDYIPSSDAHYTLPEGSKYRSFNMKEDDPVLLQTVRALTMATGASVAKFVLRVCNQTRIVENEAYSAWLAALRSRKEGTPLITVANHASTYDDPGLMGSIVPFDIVAHPKKMRWGICTQDVCFKRPFLHAIVSAGQALPIRRGGGIDQPLLLDVARHVSAGHWVHVFPEGRVIQSGQLGLDPLTKRSESEIKSKGRLKWGVGKLIAHSASTPIIIPMYHTGMQQVMLQNNIWRPDGKGGQLFDNR